MEDCKRRGSTLAEIESAEENDWIKKNLLEHLFQGKTITEWTVSVLWIGGNCPRRSKDKEKCRWQADNSEFSYHNWHDDDPSGDGPCVFLAKDGKWADYPCKHERFYVCEKAA
ncbi:collectin-12-like [Saccostrea cucullata]|uniref:collectin-12-like n=1 Tax=Saccostrea cuccullata TaxID=36930 RepID=UPI002ED23AB2